MSPEISLKERIAGFTLFDGISDEHLTIIDGCASIVEFDKGEYLFREGDQANVFYLILKGRVALQIALPENGVLRILTLNDDDVLGWSWLTPPYRKQFSALALETTEAICIDGRCLRLKCEADSQLGYEILKRVVQVVDQRLEATRLQLLDLYGPA